MFRITTKRLQKTFGKMVHLSVLAVFVSKSWAFNTALVVYYNILSIFLKMLKNLYCHILFLRIWSLNFKNVEIKNKLISVQILIFVYNDSLMMINWKDLKLLLIVLNHSIKLFIRTYIHCKLTILYLQFTTFLKVRAYCFTVFLYVNHVTK